MEGKHTTQEQDLRIEGTFVISALPSSLLQILFIFVHCRILILRLPDVASALTTCKHVFLFLVKPPIHELYDFIKINNIFMLTYFFKNNKFGLPYFIFEP